MKIFGIENARTQKLQHVFLAENMDEAKQQIKIGFSKKIPMKTEIEGLQLVEICYEWVAADHTNLTEIFDSIGENRP